MKFGYSNTTPALMGHCPHCHRFMHVLMEDLEEDDGEPDFDFTSVKRIPGARCYHCGHRFTAVKDGHDCLACERAKQAATKPQVVAPVRVQASVPVPPPVPMMTCTYCGSQRPAGGRFCPHCRLDSFGRAADGGAWDFGFHTG